MVYLDGELPFFMDLGIQDDRALMAEKMAKIPLHTSTQRPRLTADGSKDERALSCLFESL